MSQLPYWPSGSITETTLSLTRADVCRFLVSDWLPTLPIAASRSVLGWPYFLMRAASGTAGSTFWVIEPIAGWSERQWKGVLSWMLGVAGTRRVLAEEGYRWIAPVSAFYPTRNRPVAIPIWHLAYPPSILEIDADPQNKSRLRPDYIAIRLQSDGNLEFALVESKGTSRCLSNIPSCPPDWARQARNGLVSVQGAHLNIPRHLVVATRCNPNGLQERSRRIQVRAWNSRSHDLALDGEESVLLEVISAHYFGLFRNLGLWNNLRALQLAVGFRRAPTLFSRSELERLAQDADSELRDRGDWDPYGQREANFPITNDLGTIRIQVAWHALELIRSLRSGIDTKKLIPSLKRLLHQLDEWYAASTREYEESRGIAVDRSGFLVETKDVRVPDEF